MFYSLDSLSIGISILYFISVFQYVKSIIAFTRWLLLIRIGIVLFTITFLYISRNMMNQTTLIGFVYGMQGILYIVYSKTSFARALLVTGNILLHLLCIKGIVVSSYALLMNESIQVRLPVFSNYDVTTVIILCMLLLIYFTQRKKIKRNLIHLEKNAKVIGIISFVILIDIVILIAFENVYLNFNESALLMSYHLVLSLILLGSYYIILYYSIAVGGWNQSQQKTEFLEEQIRLQAKQFETINEKIQELRKIKHDCLSSLCNIDRLLEIGEVKEAIDYVKIEKQSISNQVNPYKQFSNNRALDVYISEIYEIVKKENIKFSASLVIEKLPVSDYELCKIFKNLFDKAIMECAKVEGNRFIHIESFAQNNWQKILFTSSCDVALLQNESNNLKAVQKIMKQKGLCEFIVKQDKGIFEVFIGMSLTSNREKKI